MIPRFNYSYSLRDAWATFRCLLSSQRPDNANLNVLFPASSLNFVSSARVGISFALQSFDLKKGANIGVQPYTCSSVLSAITAAGYKPVFIDINAQLTIDINDLRRKRAQLDALIVTHTFGIPADIRQIKQIIGILPVLEDCAHAFLCRYEGTPVGNFFDAAVYSFGDGKFPSFGSGGLLVINNPQYTGRVMALQNGLPPLWPLSELTLMAKRLLKAMIHSRVGSLLQHRLLPENAVSKRNKTFPLTHILKGDPAEALPVLYKNSLPTLQSERQGNTPTPAI
jgi:perosamine synthetase